MSFNRRVSSVTESSGIGSFSVEMSVTPKLLADGEIAFELTATRSEVTSLHGVKFGNAEMPVPEIQTESIRRNAVLANGAEFIVPFGPERVLNIAVSRN